MNFKERNGLERARNEFLGYFRDPRLGGGEMNMITNLL